MLFVFGYGSLVSPESVELTLRHAIDRSTFAYAQLRGWRRAWNVGSDQESHPERTFRLPDGTEYGGLTVVLGIEPGTPADVCDGSVFAVTHHDVALLDIRERNYERIDITGLVAWDSRPENCAIYTYTPKKTAIARIAAAQASHREINVRRGYIDLVEAAFAAAGRLGRYRRTTPDIPYPIQEMEVFSPEPVQDAS